MKILLGRGLGGPCHSRDHGRLGEPIWGFGDLLRDLELRLCLPERAADASARLPAWTHRVRRALNAATFYASSFERDELGTSEALLVWRDGLIEAGWDGQRIPNGGPRLDEIHAIEHASDQALPMGEVDRLVRVEQAMMNTRFRFYDEIALIDERALLSQRWQRILAQLEARGVSIRQHASTWTRAPASTDLGRLQSILVDDPVEDRSEGPKGDGSLLVIRGNTNDELAELSAAWLASRREEALLVRCQDPAPLEYALARYGLPTLGLRNDSGARPALQVLPLALELAFEPRDPFRVLELLTLPLGPFRGVLGAKLARAVARRPGIGSPEWERQKENALETIANRRVEEERAKGAPEDVAKARAADVVAERRERIRTWIELESVSPEGASREALLALAQRVQSFLRRRMVSDDDRPIYGPAYVVSSAFAEALSRMTDAALTREQVRRLLGAVTRGDHPHACSVEGAGRLAHVDHPSAILASASTVLLWCFVGGTERRPTTIPWTRAERAALTAAGVVAPDAAAELTAEAQSWRNAVLSARERVIFVVPETVKGTSASAHPLWDEIYARLALDRGSEARLVRHAKKLLNAAADELPPVRQVVPLELPSPHSVWSVRPELTTTSEPAPTSLTALETLGTCPLSWALTHRAKIGAGAIAKVASGALLNGNLGHRLVEVLHENSAFNLEEPAFVQEVQRTLDTLIRTEGSTLLLPGGTFEREQLEAQLSKSMRSLFRYLARSGFAIAAVEQPIVGTSPVGAIDGRLDVRLEHPDGRQAVLDLKWGGGKYRTKIERGTALQLACYARALGESASQKSKPRQPNLWVSQGGSGSSPRA